MVNENDEKNENPEESEYHFSDDEINFDDDIDSPKPATAVTESKGNIFTRLSSSKRMIISLVVFLILVFIVYKMVTPTSTTAINTDIAPVPVSQMQASPPATQVQMTTNVAPPATTTTVTKTAPAVSVPTSQPVVSAPVTTASTTTVSLPPPGGMPPAPVTYTQTTSTAPTTQPNTTVTTTTGPQMPPVIPVTSAQPYSYPAPTVQAVATESKLANLSAQTNAVVAQLEANYNQKLTEYNLQNKALQDRVDALAAKVGLMETQFNQLIQVLTRNPPVNETPTVSKSNDDSIPYTVQAIIPGRAWLKSTNGETLTITEGDMIKEVGRVSKIDPYDGIVEINTGTKVISLSYGSDGS